MSQKCAATMLMWICEALLAHKHTHVYIYIYTHTDHVNIYIYTRCIYIYIHTYLNNLNIGWCSIALSGPVGRLGRVGVGPLGFVQDYSDRLVKVYSDSIDRLGAARFRTKNRTYQQKQIWGLPLPLEVRTYTLTHNRCHWKVPFGNWVSTLLACWVYPQVRLIRLRKRLSCGWMNLQHDAVQMVQFVYCC